MALITLHQLHLAFGAAALLDGATLTIRERERVCLLGRNGAGKSTLMRVINADLVPDGGEIMRRQGLRTALVSQEVPAGIEGSVFDVVAAGLGEQAALLARFHHIGRALAEEATPALLDELGGLQKRLEETGGWELHQRAEQVINHLRLPADQPFANLSGGLKRRVMLGRALVADPDILLLDEPTNHLDLDTIAWLEDFLVRRDKALVFVTHDRSFLQRVATRIVELDRGNLSSWDCDYATYLARREEQLAAEEKQQAEFDKKLAREEAWIRQGIKARRTRNMGRVRALQQLRAERRARRERTGTAALQVQEGERSGRLVIEAEGLGYTWDDRPLIRDFSTTILRGDKVGIIGPNGSGKTTLLQLLLGELAPQQGRLKLGTNLQIAYFDQLRAQLDENRTVHENLAEGNDWVEVGGQRRHVMGYLQDFLFPPERARSPVRTLSGGERNRLLLAKLFTRPANLLVLDEPTNDLDLETLELLEDLLVEFAGTVLLVSHDRAFLDNVVTSTLVLEGEGRVGEYVGGYEDWLRQRPQVAQPPKADARKPERHLPKERPRKLSFKEKQELDSLPRRIEELEAEQADLHARLSDPNFYRGGGGEVAGLQARLALIEDELARAYVRWEDLEALG
ncbi:ATP-binding cassette domain-containing protein [Geoalkalibacter sp.]|uniref:ATP-binding cassette domain-containing protein n=1 Tax=Geoalkalibacter sp. TaxID=3041440 RepID=UPI00272E75E6|nr:ATP-binding cassette domain-containing protein [Geoalkalibacter sp.]